ncbi:MAG: right-handed parallel beta-helix repeat-containing protein [Planctomycetota bacterium]
MKHVVPVLASVALAVASLTVLVTSSSTAPAAPAPMLPAGTIPISSLPFTISSSGHYCLTSSLLASSGDDGITIDASFVELDLAGFELKGVRGSQIGIDAQNRLHVVIRNGRVSFFDEGGIRGASNVVVEDVEVIQCGGTPIELGLRARVERVDVQVGEGDGVVVGDDSLVRECTIRMEETAVGALSCGDDCVVADVRTSRGASGIVAGARCRIERCTTSENTAVGMSVESCATVRDCCIDAAPEAEDAFTGGDDCLLENVRTSGGLRGITCIDRAQLSKCCVVDPTERGIFVGTFSVVEDCSADVGFDASVACRLSSYGKCLRTTTLGGQKGIVNAQRAQVVDCSVTGATQVGIEVTSGSTVRGCGVSIPSTGTYGIRIIGSGTCDSCSVSGGAVGIGGLSICLVTDCTAVESGEKAIELTSRGQVRGCVAYLGFGDGIVLGDDCVARDNACTGIVGRGIVAAGDRNRIEGNSVNDCGVGLELVGQHNLTIGNQAMENTTADFLTPISNPTGAVLKDFGTIDSSRPQANHGTPVF